MKYAARGAALILWNGVTECPGYPEGPECREGPERLEFAI